MRYKVHLTLPGNFDYQEVTETLDVLELVHLLEHGDIAAFTVELAPKE